MANKGRMLLKSAIIMVQTEATDGVDPGSWDPALHALRLWEPATFDPLGQNSSADIMPVAGPKLSGTVGTIPGTYWSTLSLKFPVAGTGDNTSAATLLPDFEPIVLACSLPVTTDATPWRRYGTALQNATCHIKILVGPSQDDLVGPNNWKEYRMGGCAGTIKMTGGADGAPALFECDFQGTYNDPIDVADPGDPDLTGMADPEPFHTIGTTWNTHEPVIKSWEVDFGNNVVPRRDLNKAGGVRSFMITNQLPVVSMQVEEELAAQQDYWTDYTGKQKGVLETGAIGSAGNQWLFNANLAQLASLSMTEADDLLAIDAQWKCHGDLSDLDAPAAYFQLQ